MPVRSRLLRPHFEQSARHQPRLQKSEDKPEHPLVLDLAAHAPHEHVVDHPAEELLQIHVHHKSLADSDMLPFLLRGLMRASTWTEPVDGIGEAGIEDRREHLTQRLLDQTVHGRRDAQLPCTARAWESRPQDRLRFVAPVQK